MRITTIVTGLVGGLLVAAALAAPLYVGLPARYLPAWGYMTPQGTMYGFLGAFAAAVVTGAVAAALRPDDAVRSGTAAGLWASLIANMAMVVPTATLEASSELLLLAQARDGVAGSDDFPALVERVVVALGWYPVAASAVMLVAGVAMGAVGGVVYDLWQGVPSPSKRGVRWTIVPLVSLLAGVLWTGATMTGLAWLVSSVLKPAGATLTFLEIVKLSAPAALLLAFSTGFLAWVFRDAMLLYRDERRLRSTVWIAMATGALLVMLVEMGLLFPGTWLSPLTWVTLGLGSLVAIVTLVLTTRADEYLDSAPRQADELVGDSLIVSILILGQGILGGGSAAWAIGTIVLPYAEAAELGAAGLTWTPVMLAARLFQAHWVATSAVVLLAGAWLMMGLPFWLFGRAVAPRGR